MTKIDGAFLSVICMGVFLVICWSVAAKWVLSLSRKDSPSPTQDAYRGCGIIPGVEYNDFSTVRPVGRYVRSPSDYTQFYRNYLNTALESLMSITPKEDVRTTLTDVLQALRDAEAWTERAITAVNNSIEPWKTQEVKQDGIAYRMVREDHFQALNDARARTHKLDCELIAEKTKRASDVQRLKAAANDVQRMAAEVRGRMQSVSGPYYSDVSNLASKLDDIARQLRG
jgi:hypothetical protein